MSRPNENPVYEEVQHDEIEEIYDEDLAEIQAAPAAITNARTPQQPTPREPTGHRFIPPPPPPIEVHPHRAYGTIPFRSAHQQDQRYQQEARDVPSRQRFGNHISVLATVDRSSYGTSEPDRNGSKTPTKHQCSRTILKNSPKHHNSLLGKRG